MKKFPLFTVILFVLGILFRVFLVYSNPQDFVMDQQEYHKAALDILGEKEHMYISAYRASGYPMFLAVIYSIFGRNNLDAVRFVQIILDVFTGVAVYILAGNVFRKKIIARLAYIIYLFNPYTSAYTGVLLTEVLATFLIAAIFLLLQMFLIKKKAYYALLLSFYLSYLPQVRPGFLYFSLIFFGILVYRVLRVNGNKITKLFLTFALTGLFALPFVYNMMKNRIYFGRPAIMTVDRVFVRELYISLFIEESDIITRFPPEVSNVYIDFSRVNTNEERKQLSRKYMELSLEEIRRDPGRFILSRFKKTYKVWEKHQLFPYRDTENKLITRSAFLTNSILLMFSVAGIIYSIRQNIHKKIKMDAMITVLLTLFLAVYISFVHMFTLTSGRFSLPAYPMVMLFAAAGINRAVNSVLNKINNA